MGLKMNLKEQYNRIGGKQLLNEASLRSNIMQKWNTTSVIKQDLMGFISHAMDAGGEELVEDIYAALIASAKYAEKVRKRG